MTGPDPLAVVRQWGETRRRLTDPADYVMQQLAAAVEDARAAGCTVTDIIQAAGIARRTYYAMVRDAHLDDLDDTALSGAGEWDDVVESWGDNSGAEG